MIAIRMLEITMMALSYVVFLYMFYHSYMNNVVPGMILSGFFLLGFVCATVQYIKSLMR